MSETSKDIRFLSLDGLSLEGTFQEVNEERRGIAVLVHGGGVDRNEDGFYVRFADVLARSKIASFRFDLRVHGRSEGKPEELTPLGVVNDIYAAVELMLSYTDIARVHLIGTSFGGGLSAYFTSKFPDKVASLALMCPLLNYKLRLLEQKSFWKEGHMTQEGIKDLNRDGYLRHGSAFRMGRPFLNELFHVHPYLLMSSITVPTLTVHGTEDNTVPYEIARDYHQVNAPSEFLSIEGADHGFTIHGDVDYSNPQTRAWQQIAFDATVGWILKFNSPREVIDE